MSDKKVAGTAKAAARILIVEDVRFVAARLQRTLTGLGYDILGAVASGEEALQVVSERRPDLVLMDIELAGELNGIETSAQIRAQSDIPVIYLTGHAEDALLQQARITAPYGYLIKPAQDKELHATIEMALHRHELERALRASEQRLRNVLENSRDATYELNLETGAYDYFSPSARQSLGFTPEEILALGFKGVEARFHPQDRERLKARFDSLLEHSVGNDVAPTIEYRWKCKDGEYRWFSDHYTLVRDKDDRPSALIGSIRDITAQVRAEEELWRHRERLEELVKERTAELVEAVTGAERLNEQLQQEIIERVCAERALRESEASYRELADSITDVFFAMDKDLRYTYWNRASKELTGISAEDAIGKSLLELFPDTRETKIEELYLEVLRTQQPQGFVNEYRLGDRNYFFEINAYPSRDGISVFTKDITERVRAEEEVRRRNRELALLNRVIATATSTLDVEQVLQIACQELAHAFDLPQAAATLLNAERTEATVVAEYRAPGRPSALDKTIPATSSPATEYVLEHQAPLAVADAQTDARMAPVHDLMRERGTLSLLIVPVMERGQVVGTIGLDAIERREFSAEEIILAQNVAAAAGQALERTRLYQELQRHAAELARTLEKRRELDRLRGEFIRNVSHELRTPLTLARGHVELLETGFLGELQPEQCEPVAVIARRMRALSKIVDDITALLDTEGQGATQELVDLGDLAQAMLANFQSTVEEAGLMLATQVASDLQILGDPVQLQQILDSLLDNACKFTAAGGCISVRLEQDGTNVILEVSDSGIGISDDQLERIFERFYQIDGSTTRRYGGTGLGLALVKEVVEAHGGRVTVQSAVGQGSTFTVTLPIFPANLLTRAGG